MSIKKFNKTIFTLFFVLVLFVTISKAQNYCLGNIFAVNKFTDKRTCFCVNGTIDDFCDGPSENYEKIEWRDLEVPVGEFDKSILEPYPNLKIFVCQNCSIDSIADDAFSGKLKLEYIDLKKNHIKDLDLTQFDQLPSLKELSVNFNENDYKTYFFNTNLN